MYWVGGGGYSQWQPACQASAWHWEQLCVGGWEAEKVPFTASCLHLPYARRWVWHRPQSLACRAPEYVRDGPSARSLGVELKRVTKLSHGYSVLTVASGQAWTRCLVALSYPFLSVSLSDKCCLSLPFCFRGRQGSQRLGTDKVTVASFQVLGTWLVIANSRTQWHNREWLLLLSASHHCLGLNTCSGNRSHCSSP